MKFFIFTKKQLLTLTTLIGIFLLTFAWNLIQINTKSIPTFSDDLNDFMEAIQKLPKKEEKVAYLTFDDGPSLSVTPKILEILKEEDIKATFFVIGKSVEAHPEIVRQAYAEGHYIANHSYTHNAYFLYQSAKNFQNEIRKTDEAIGKAIGEKDYCAHLFRFPTGYMTPTYQKEKKEAVKLLKEMEYAYIDWNALNNDSIKKCTNYELMQTFKKTTKNKNTLIVLMHDTRDVNDSSKVLKESIEMLKAEGYEFKNFYDIVEEYF